MQLAGDMARDNNVAARSARTATLIPDIRFQMPGCAAMKSVTIAFRVVQNRDIDAARRKPAFPPNVGAIGPWTRPAS